MTTPSDIIKTAPVTVLFDPLIYPPPVGMMLLVINEGGVLIKSQWYAGAMAWGYLPQIPETVKKRHQRTK